MNGQTISRLRLYPASVVALKYGFCRFSHALGVTVKVRLVAFFYAILELLLDALRLSHNVLLDTALGYG